MAYTANEQRLISLLRTKMGDKPFMVDGNGSPLLDINGNPIIDTSKVIWMDSEYHEALTSALTRTFKGKKSSLDYLDIYEAELVILQGQIDLVIALAVDAVKYVKYTTKDTGIEKMSVGQLINLANSLKGTLKDMMDEAGEVAGIGNAVVVSVLRRYDNQLDAMLPIRYQPTPKFPPFRVTEKVGHIEVFMGYAFIDDYRAHYLKRIEENGSENILATYYILQDTYFKDANIVPGKKYKYRLYIESINSIFSYIEIEVTYAGA